ncbi:hypothetical protein [Parageobacillus thermoglucosidasius]|uniref:hypothetical protein n=1 Tax=Parageobacillus thermoglucosidasius TaxID=1426 RepID=UPI000E11981E|nr:hypothetical protein [Parageobacillus thermoglucosidasius]MED4903970.1 hypothetical protein [Parageobacillus thermoglucosidasius]MED4915706.1 hypothetical protein [Parageobacillus thermoglucosidasius]MED4945539.1 hypothetical protein [Parageobacillus thermoglucosidasius]MED4984106.1 hypothetical protein [Parageobacillus thermoglucosidasius]RDE18568.1 hypothetical protein DV714_20655 [Parageobacillus thermoglucosidasius]
MNYLHYEYCLSDFVVVEAYEKEYFTKEDDKEEFPYHTIMLKNINAKLGKKDNQLAGKLRRIYVPQEIIEKYLDEGEKKFVYNPLSDTPGLYLEMYKIKIFNDATLMKFIQNYGIPYHQQIPIGSSGVYPTALFQRNEIEKLLIGMDVLMFYEQLLELQKAIEIWNDIREENIQRLKQLQEEFEFYACFQEKYETEFKEALSVEELTEFVFSDLGIAFGGEIDNIIEKYKENPEKLKRLSIRASEYKITWEQVKNTDLKNIAMAYLNLKLKKLPSGKTSTRFTKGKIVPAISFENLIEVASYQLKQAIFKEAKLERCLNCGGLFEPLHGSQKFCPPRPNKKRSTCENTYNQRLKRQRRRERQQNTNNTPIQSL